MDRRTTARLVTRPGAAGPGRSRALLRVAVGGALVLAVLRRGGPSGSSVSMAQGPSRRAPVEAPAGTTYTLMQTNLCLSGFAGCYARVAYPTGAREAAARIRKAHPDAVTVNEGCGGDVARIARRTGYHLRFSPVTAAGEPIACMSPGGRGLFGEAVLTRAAVAKADSRAFAAQAGSEQRRWLCVATAVGVEVCTAHLATRSTVESTANDAQCAELAALLERRAAARTVIFGGDVNRRRPCAPRRAWARTDRSADQIPGLQGVYGAGALRSPSAQVVPAAHTDHDVLLVRAQLTAA